MKMFVAFVVSLLSLSPAASADVIYVEFAGHITYVNDTVLPNWDLDVDDTFTGSFAYDTDAPDNAPENNGVGGYSFPDRSMAVTLGSMPFSVSSIAVGVMVNPLLDRLSAGNIDDFEAYGMTWRSLSVRLGATDHGVIPNDHLPTVWPDLSQFDLYRGIYLVPQNSHNAVVTGDLDWLVSYPEPDSLVLILAGSLLLSRRRFEVNP